MKPKLLIVDDEELIRWSLSQEFSASGYQTLTAESAPQAMQLIDKESPDLVLADLRLGSSNGMDILREVRRKHPEISVILMTAFADVSSAVEALREGAADYILKPFQLDALKLTLKRVLETSALKRRMTEAQRRHKLHYSFDSIIALSASMRQILDSARKMAASPQGTILLLGESGTGKDLLARAIHYESERAAQPFMEISCTAIPEQLLESELFGHEKGSFTDAKDRKKGLFDLAAGGTVFLNEIGHMPLGLQAKILRVLEDKTFRRVGGQEDLTVDVRIMAATNQDLEKAVAEKTFRTDLYYRLNVLPLRLLPLRERREDIPRLTDHLLERLSRELRRPKPKLPEEVRRAFLEHPWPGNVRELRNVLERMMILDDISLGGCRFFQTPSSPSAAPASSSSTGLFYLPDGGINLEEAEKDLVRQAMQKAGANQVKAAELLGISRDALRRRLEKFGLKTSLLFLIFLCFLAQAQAGWFGGGTAKQPKEDPFLSAHKKEAEEMKSQLSVHAPVRSGTCSSCHSSPQYPKKLAQELKALCLSCHKKRQDDLKKSTVHMPFKESDCSTCHQPHASGNPSLLIDKVNALCLACHALDGDPVKNSHFKITSIEANCTDCHTPHGSANAHLIREEKQHPPFESRACDFCHQETGKDGKARLKEPLSEACFTCHADLKELANAKTVHMPFAVGECATCHFPHVAAQRALLKSPPQTLCRTCHDAIPDVGHPVVGHPAFKEGKSNPRDPGKPFDCASCHNPHGSQWPKLRQADPGTFCLTCHQK